LLAYTIGFQLYLRQRRSQGDVVDGHTRWSLIAAVVIGAAAGSRLLYWLENPGETLAHWNQIEFLLGGKTVVGALLGGTIAVELTKRALGLARRTGDLYAVPLALGIAIGRVGCLLSGLADNTYGLPTSLPWGIDLGDGIRRHPVQLYETIAMTAFAGWLNVIQRRRHREGDVFRLFMVGYLGWRLLVDALKPEPHVWGPLSSLQLAALGGLIYYLPDIRRWLTRGVTLDREILTPTGVP
jgi:prolipoprotein diacylglyceryltransferase